MTESSQLYPKEDTMKTLRLFFYATIVSAFAATLGGCVAMTPALYTLYSAASLGITGLAAYDAIAPGDSFVKVGNEDSGLVQAAALLQIRKVVTSDQRLGMYLEESGAFDQVKFTNTPSAGMTYNKLAAKASSNKADAFMLIEFIRTLPISETRIAELGAVRMTLVNTSGIVAYEQTVSLQQKANSALIPSQRDLDTGLANVIAEDLKVARELAMAGDPVATKKTTSTPGEWLDRVNPF